MTRALEETKDQQDHQGKWDLKGPKGAKGEQGNQGLQRNWKQCAWKNINEDKDSGLIKVKGS